MKKKDKVNINIMNNVAISDLVRVHFWQVSPGNFQAAFECLEPNKNVIFDDKALAELNRQITAKMKGTPVNTPEQLDKATKFMEEYLMRMITELHKNGLVALDNAPNAPKDHYADLRESWDKPKFN